MATNTPAPKRDDRTAPKASPIHLVLRIVAMLIGLPLLVLAIAACIGLLIDTPWICLILAVLVAVVPALFLVDRLLPEADPLAGRGIPTDVLATVWLGFATLAFGPFGHALHAPLSAFLSRLAGHGALVTAAEYATGSGPYGARPVTEASVDAGTSLAVPHATDAGTPVRPAPSPADSGTVIPEDAGAVPAETTPTGASLTPAEVFRRYAGSVVTIDVVRGGADEGQRGSGTGFLIDAQGTIATNAHVIHDARAVRVKLLDGTYATTVRLLTENAQADLALIRITTPHALPPVRLGDSEQIEVGERVIVIGNPLGLEHTLSDGIVSARRRLEDRNLIQMTAPVSPGNSGGPVFDGHGDVIGVSTAVVALGYAQNLNLAVPINQLRALVSDTYPAQRAWSAVDASATGGHW